LLIGITGTKAFFRTPFFKRLCPVMTSKFDDAINPA
jgi:hypothetical protein